MNLSVRIIAVLFILIIVAQGKDDPKYDRKFRKAELKGHQIRQEQHIFTQVVDHFDYRQEQFFNQRYWVAQDYFSPKVGPVFLYICGEWVCSGIPELRSWVGVLAQQLKGIVLVLEHRFYGDSLPFGKESFSI